MTYPVDTIEGLAGLGALNPGTPVVAVGRIGGLADAISTGLDVLFPGFVLLRELRTPSPIGGTEAGRRALRLFHQMAGPSPWTPVVAGGLLAGLVIGAAVIAKKSRTRKER